MPQYETSIEIPSFAGINQARNGYNQSPSYAFEMENVNVENGNFAPMREGLEIQQHLENPIGTLAYLHRRYAAENEPKTLLVAISDGKVYTKALDQDDAWQVRYTGLTVDDCDWVTYEINREGDTDEQGTPSPVDVLLFTNATDGMFCLYGDNLTVEAVETPYKFGVLARYNERIWGAGILAMPDSMVYSAPYNPFDWEAQTEIPEDGAGEIMQPTWDGDRFIALRQHGSDLLAFKRNSVWQVYGTNPGEFVVRRQYGGGTVEENTVAVYGDMAYMLGGDGIVRYNGNGVYPFRQEAVKVLMQERVNQDAIHQAVGAMRGNVYCLALPINGSTFCNAVLEYNILEQSFALRTEISIDTFLAVDERLFYTSAQSPGKVFEMRDDIGRTLPCSWKSCYQDLGLKSSIKSAFTIYMMVEAETTIPLYIGMRTEKKLKQKIFNVKPGKITKLKLNSKGRFFRLEIQSYSAVPFKILGGIKIDLELDPD